MSNRKPTNESILRKLSQLKSVSDIERDSGLARGRLGDLKLSRVTLSEGELQRVWDALEFVQDLHTREARKRSREK